MARSVTTTYSANVCPSFGYSKAFWEGRLTGLSYSALFFIRQTLLSEPLPVFCRLIPRINDSSTE